MTANACFLLASVGLILLNAFAPVLLPIIYNLFGLVGDTTALFWLNLVYYLPCVLLPAILVARKCGAQALRLAPVPRGMTIMSVLTALICVFAVNALSLIWMVILESIGLTTYSTSVAMETTHDLAMGVLVIGVMPGICEEMLFRGAALSGYERFGTRRALWITSLLFASLHGSVQGLPGQLLMGLVLGAVVCASGSLYTGMMVHTVYNSLLVMLMYLGGAANTADTYAETMSIVEYLGGAAGMFVICLQCVLPLLALAAMLRWFFRHAAGELVARSANSGAMSISEILVLASGVVTVMYLYATDIMYMLGYLG